MNKRTIVVAGGGLAGLTAAALAARAGHAVTLVERSREPGGRARVTEKDGFQINLGPHALYRQGEAQRVLASLGIQPDGVVPEGGQFAEWRGRRELLPGGPLSLATTGLLSTAEKLELGLLLARLSWTDPAPLERVTVAEWIARESASPVIQGLLHALVRVTSYGNAAARQSAGATVRQLQIALAGSVWYLHGGWRQLVDALAERAREAGVQCVTGAGVARLDLDGSVRGVHLDDGRRLACDACVLAIPPDAIDKLLVSDAPKPMATYAACLDLCLARLPVPETRFVLGLDRPLYFSAESVWARVAPDGRALVHVMKYLEPGAKPGVETRTELETWLDDIQPGWRDHVLDARYAPHLPVAHALPLAESAGLAGRPPVAFAGIDGLYRAGDWVGKRGMLADASFASAEEAVQLIDSARALKVA